MANSRTLRVVFELIAIYLTVLRAEGRTEVEFSGPNQTKPEIEGRQFGGPIGVPFISYGIDSGNGGNAIPIQQAGNHLEAWTAITFPPAVEHKQQLAAQVAPAAEVSVRSEPVVPIKNNYKLAVTCGDDFMTVKMDFDRPFHGIVYSKGYFNKPQCVHVRGDKFSRTFNLTVNYNTCGSYNRKAQAPHSAFATTTTTPPTTTSTLSSTDTTTPFSIVRQMAITPIPLFPPPVQDSLENNQFYQPATPPSFNEPQQPLQQQQQFPQPNQLYSPVQQAPLPNQLYQPQPVQQQFQPFQQGSLPLYNIPQYQLPTGLLYGQYGQPLQQNVYGLNGLSYPFQQAQLYPQGALPAYLPNIYGDGLARPMARSMDDDEEAPTVGMQWVENTIVIQQDANVQDALDDAKSLQCEWKEQYNKKIVTEGYKVEMADVVRASFPGDNVGAYMQIKTGLSPLSPDTRDVVKIGSPLTLFVGLTNSTGNFDLLVHSCMATGSDRSPQSRNRPSIQLVDEKGCVTRDKYFGPFMPFRSPTSAFGKNRVVYAYFQAFKFPDSTEVNIECSVTICRNSCPAQCAGRYYKGSENVVKVTASPLQTTLHKKPLTRPFNVNSTFSQGRIIEALERRLSSVNGPQEITVDKSADNGSRFLMLRQLDDASAASNLSAPTTSLPVLLKMKREVELESSNVDLRRKMTVINRSDVDGFASDFLLVGMEASPSEVPPERSLLPIQPFTSLNNSDEPMKKQSDEVHAAAAVQKVTETPAFYAVQDGYQHICLPLLALIGAGVGAALLVLMFLVCGVCFCCRYRGLLKKQKQSFNLYSTTSTIYSDPKPTGLSPVRARNFTEL